MARLIDADDFLKWLDVGHLRNPGEVCFCEADVAHMIKSRATIDPVHAAGACYCRECTCWNRHDDILPDCRFPDWGYCSKMLDSDSEIEITTLENDFCSRGQRLEED